MQVPGNQGARFDYKRCQKELNKLGITNIRIIPEKNWVKKDFQRFLEPLQFDKKEKLSRILYGGGRLKIVFTKS